MVTTPDGKKLVTLIPGDGIGAECVESARRIIEASGAKVAWEIRHAGESVFKQGIASGVPATHGYPHLLLAMGTLASGMGLVMAPATESIMGSLPPSKAGVLSA